LYIEIWAVLNEVKKLQRSEEIVRMIGDADKNINLLDPKTSELIALSTATTNICPPENELNSPECKSPMGMISPDGDDIRTHLVGHKSCRAFLMMQIATR
jgi:hypothetical protein